ncbi:MAG: hypothetical protein QM766_29030 [Burkholderiaceae bacterium]
MTPNKGFHNPSIEARRRSMKHPMDLTDHHIIVTGAAQGIGEAVARR